MKLPERCYQFINGDLHYWWQFDLINVKNASRLSLGDCPNKLADIRNFDPDAILFNRLWQQTLANGEIRAKYAISAIENNSPDFKSYFIDVDEDNKKTYFVSLPEFRDWARKNNLRMNKIFEQYEPSDHQTLLIETAEKLRSEAKRKGIEGNDVCFPYLTEFIVALPGLMIEHYPKDNPELWTESNIVSVDINKALGISSQSGTGKSIARAIRPGELPKKTRSTEVIQSQGTKRPRKKKTLKTLKL